MNKHEVIIGDCPLGAKCEELKEKDGKPILVRCPWYTMVRGRKVNTGEEVDDWGCAIAWLPALLTNNTAAVTGCAVSTQNLQNNLLQSLGDKNKNIKEIKEIEG